MEKKVRTNEGDGTIVGVHKWGVTIDLDSGGTVTRSTEVKSKSYKEKMKPLGPNEYRILETLVVKNSKLQILENKIRKMVKEEMLKEGKLTPGQQRAIQKSLWKILESIRGSVDSSVYSSGESFLRALNDEFGSTAPI